MSYEMQLGNTIYFSNGKELLEGSLKCFKDDSVVVECNGTELEIYF
jgi:hypothetical protein